MATIQSDTIWFCCLVSVLLPIWSAGSYVCCRGSSFLQQPQFRWKQVATGYLWHSIKWTSRWCIETLWPCIHNNYYCSIIQTVLVVLLWYMCKDLVTQPRPQPFPNFLIFTYRGEHLTILCILEGTWGNNLNTCGIPPAALLVLAPILALIVCFLMLVHMIGSIRYMCAYYSNQYELHACSLIIVVAVRWWYTL